MKILVVSYAFSPSVGGIENSSEILAGAFTDAGNEVRLVTHEARSDGCPRSYRIIRRPHARLQWRLYRWADVILHNNLSVRYLWPRWLTKAPCIITIQTWLSGSADVQTTVSCLKQVVLVGCCVQKLRTTYYLLQQIELSPHHLYFLILG